MSNWCEGTLKIRGKIENIVKFLEEGTTFIEGILEQKQIRPKIKLNEDYEIEIDNIDKEKGINYLYIKGTTRHFIDNVEKWIDIYNSEEKEAIICLDGFKAAWGIDAKELRKISHEYSIDFKVYGFERGMEFNQDIEIIKGRIIKDEEIKFKNYKWECIEPNMGG